MATLEYNVDLKAIKEVYPTAENSERVLNIVMDMIKEQYSRIRTNRMKEEATENASLRYLGFNLNPEPVNVYPEYDDAVVGAYAVTQGTSYNEVVTMDAKITLTVNDQNAVKVLLGIDVIGTFYITPANRLTAY